MFKTLGQRNNYEISICMTFERNKITNMEHMTNMEKKK